MDADAQTFTNNTGAVGTSHTILDRLLGGTSNASNAALFQITPGVEIINTNVDTSAHLTAGDLTLATSWDLSTMRYGSNNPSVSSIAGSGTPGILTLRAGGNVVFDFGASLSDGFQTGSLNPSNPSLLGAGLLPAGDLSWSYQITAGADLSAAASSAVLSASTLQALGSGGSVLLGQGGTATQHFFPQRPERLFSDHPHGHGEYIDRCRHRCPASK